MLLAFFFQTLGGSLAIGNANSDAIVPLVAAGAYITVMSKGYNHYRCSTCSLYTRVNYVDFRH